MLAAGSRPAAATPGNLLNFTACSTRNAVARPPSVPSKSRSTRSRRLLHSRDFGRRCGLKQVALSPSDGFIAAMAMRSMRARRRIGAQVRGRRIPGAGRRSTLHAGVASSNVNEVWS